MRVMADYIGWFLFGAAIVVIMIVLLSVFLYRRYQSHGSQKFCRRFIGITFSLLVAVYFLSLLVPESALIKSEVVPQKNMQIRNSYDHYSPQMFLAAIKKKALLPVGSKMTVTRFTPNNGQSSVAIECDNENDAIYTGVKGVDIPDDGDGKIEVVECIAPHIEFENVSFSPGLPSCELQYNGDRLTISGSAKKPFCFSQYENAGTVLKPFGSDLFTDSHFSDVIFVFAPSGVTVSGENTASLADAY